MIVFTEKDQENEISSGYFIYKNKPVISSFRLSAAFASYHGAIVNKIKTLLIYDPKNNVNDFIPYQRYSVSGHTAKGFLITEKGFKKLLLLFTEGKISITGKIIHDKFNKIKNTITIKQSSTQCQIAQKQAKEEKTKIQK